MGFFFLTKLATQLASPLNVALGLGALALVLLARRRARAAAASLSLALALLWLSSTQLFAFALARSLEARYPPVPASEAPEAGAIVLLGGALRMPRPGEAWSDLGSGADRLVHAARLYRAGKAPWLVASGGGMPWTPGEERPAHGMAQLLEEWGVPRDALLIEARSRNTHDNAVRTRALLAERGITDVLLVTSAMHMPRALAVFRSVGLRPVPAATDYQALGGVRRTPMAWVPSVSHLALTQWALKEYLGTAVYRLRGWIRD